MNITEDVIKELEQKSIYVITQSDDAYPNRLRRLLKKAPPLLYYCGNIALANMNSVAIVGSRIIDAEAEQYAVSLAKKAVAEGYVVCSGGAIGIDRISETAALNSGGCCISFLADSMIKKSQQPEIRDAVMNGKMLLLSAVKPDAPFNTGNAMSRNRYIYAMSQCAFVVASTYNKGGTWAGASESIKSRLINTYVWDNPKYDGNKQLIIKGGVEIGDPELFSIADLANAEVQTYPEQLSLFEDI